MIQISDAQALLLMGAIILGGLLFGIIGAYFNGTFPFNRKQY